MRASLVSCVTFLLPWVSCPVTELGTCKAQNNYSWFMQLDTNKSNRLMSDEFYLFEVPSPPPSTWFCCSTDLKIKVILPLKYSKISTLPYFIQANLIVSPLVCYTKMLIIMVAAGIFIKNIAAFNLHSSVRQGLPSSFCREVDQGSESSQLGRQPDGAPVQFQMEPQSCCLQVGPQSP